MVNIVVEGPDGAGKSTLIKQLETVYGCEALHGGGPPKDIAELEHRIYELPRTNMLMDRWSAISELIYGDILKGKSMVSEEMCLHAIEKVRPLIIYCRPPFNTLIENKVYLEREKSHKSGEHCRNVSDNFVRIICAYDALMMKLREQGSLVLTYDYTNGDFK